MTNSQKRLFCKFQERDTGSWRDLSTDAIIGTDTLGSILPHTLDIKNGLLFTEGGVSLQLRPYDCQVEFSPWGIAQFRHILRRYYIVPHVQWPAPMAQRFEA